VVEVLVDKLERFKSVTASVRSSVGTAYVVGGLGDVTEGQRWEPGDDLLDLNVLGSHNGGVWKKIVSCGGVVVVVLAGAKFSRQKTHTQMDSGQGPARASGNFAGSLVHRAGNVHPSHPQYVCISLSAVLCVPSMFLRLFGC
jgi:hypothetical protein